MHGDEVIAMRPGESPPDLVSLSGGHTRHVGDQLHHLLLPDYDAVAPLQSPLLQGVVVFPRGPVPIPLHELGHCAALDTDAGTNEGDLVGKVQESARLKTLPHLELGRRLEQEDPLGPARIDHFVHSRGPRG